MSGRRSFSGLGAVVVLGIVMACSAPAALTIKLSDVASAEDLDAEICSMTADFEQSLVSPGTFDAATGKLRRSAIQLAVIAQAVTEHDEGSKFKTAGPAIRDAALLFSQSKSYDDARSRLAALKSAMEGTEAVTAPLEFDWTKLASNRLLMDLMRDRTELVRKALRRPKDPVVESRHASVMAILALAIDAHAVEKNRTSEEQREWHSASFDLQRLMSKTAGALRTQDLQSAMESFSAGYEACDRCHEKFKR